ncbi:hypothetical protein [Glycomyces sp. NPDC047010]|uniref:hypothetical protein n=1 Tax=Glycomyces sp. NPDC047010 TaxID=3155023 RepID=UPI0033DC00BD
MNMLKCLRGAVLAAAVVAAAVLAAAPAQAIPSSWSGPDGHCTYDTPDPAPEWCSGTSAPQGDMAAAAAYSARVERQDTDFCPCTLPDAWDGTYFEHDADAWAVKITLYTPNGQIAGKIEFHPQGEYVYVYDTLTDGVSLFATINGEIYHPQGGYRYDLSFAEGANVMVSIHTSNGIFTSGLGNA